jgi:glycosyltransferase involved in cell wall biosynthesis
MLRILHVCATAERGGLETILLNVAKSLDRSRFTPHVLFLTNGPFVNEVELAGIETHVIDAGRVRQVLEGGKALAGTVRLIRDEGINLVHSHNAKAHIYGGLAASIARVPSIYHLHGVPRFAPTRDGFVSLLSVTIPARLTVACSSYVASAFKRAWHSRREITVVRNGTFPSVATASESQAVRQELQIIDGAPLVVMAARLQRWKGVHVFVEAAAHVARVHPEAQFIIVGGTLFGLEPNYPRQLQQLIERLELQACVRLVGFRTDVLSFFSAASLVVHCSIEPEPFAVVLLEAMACSKPVIASDSGGTGEIIEQGVEGLLVPPNDPEGLSKAICSLLADPELRKRMGNAGSARVRKYLNMDRMTREFERTYTELTLGVEDA